MVITKENITTEMLILGWSAQFNMWLTQKTPLEIQEMLSIDEKSIEKALAKLPKKSVETIFDKLEDLVIKMNKEKNSLDFYINGYITEGDEYYETYGNELNDDGIEFIENYEDTVELKNIVENYYAELN